jgi:hypothetical protein
LGETRFLQKNVCEFLKDFLSSMQIGDIDENGLTGLKEELNLNYYKPIGSPQCHWLTGVFKENRLNLVAGAISGLEGLSSEGMDKMVWVYLKINEKLELLKPT